jgi:hypothetical protein
MPALISNADIRGTPLREGLPTADVVAPPQNRLCMRRFTEDNI